MFDFIWNVVHQQLQRGGLRQLLASSTLLAPPSSDRQPVCLSFFFPNFFFLTVFQFVFFVFFFLLIYVALVS